MKPAPFAYRAPSTVQEAVSCLAEAPGESKLLAGGQTLVPLLNTRLIRPALVVDLNDVVSLRTIDVAPGSGRGRLRVGAMVRQRQLETDVLVQERLPLLAEACAHIAHVPIRIRGTVGGSLAHADPAAELPAAALALGARLHIQGPTAARTVEAADFFLGPLLTAIEPDELLTSIDFDLPPADTGWAFLEVARVNGAFALAGVAVLVHLAGGGHIDFARVAICGLGGTPWSPEGVDEILIGERPGEKPFADVARVVAETCEAHDDGHASASYRRSTAGVLTARALRVAAARAIGATN